MQSMLLGNATTMESLVIEFARWFVEKHRLSLDDPNTGTLATEFAKEMVGVLYEAVEVEIVVAPVSSAEADWNVERYVQEAISELKTKGGR